MNDSLGDRMKGNYEERFQSYLVRRVPAIIRVDGRAFHTLTHGCSKPFDPKFMDCMGLTARVLCQKIQGAKCAYVQSDEISILMTDYDTIETDCWFGYKIQKIVSISAAIASVTFDRLFLSDKHDGSPVFDARVFNIPVDEVANYFVWRQKDWNRNSVMMFARSFFSQKQVHEKHISDLHEMLHERGDNWANLPDGVKNGMFVTKHESGWGFEPAPVFTQSRDEIEKLLVRKD